jgi:hypothetical protein
MAQAVNGLLARRLANLPVGLLINFNVPLLRAGIRRLINSSASPRLL